MLIVAIESSCDETSLAVVERDARGEAAGDEPGARARVRVLAHRVESQIEIHQPFGGVVPEVAARDHLAKIHVLAKETLAEAGVALADCDAIAVTMGPGLIGALMVGVLYARGAALASGLPLIAVNHVDAHLAPCFFLDEFSPAKDLGVWKSTPDVAFPALALTVSGGHCILSRVLSPTERVVLGQTADDACGEAFDKVAKLLGLPYPGGPEIEKIAREYGAGAGRSQGGAGSYVFPSTLQDKANRLGFSFSGLKTAVLDAVRKETGQKLGKTSGAALAREKKAALAHAFQQAAIGQLCDRIGNALESYPDTRSFLVAGGVAANGVFREKIAALALPQSLAVRFAPLALCSDNATMIALQAHLFQADGTVIQPFPRYAGWREQLVTHTEQLAHGKRLAT